MTKSLQWSDWSTVPTSQSDPISSTGKKNVDTTVSVVQKDTESQKRQKKISLPDCPCVYGLILGLLFGIIILAIVIAMWLRSSSTTITTTTTTTTSAPSNNNVITSCCSLTTCIGKETPYRLSIGTVLYPFDGTFTDISGRATGTPFGSPVPVFMMSTYVGSLSAFLAVSLKQYIQIPYVDLAQQSFTLQVWIYLYTVTIPSDFGIFGQCDSNLICLSLSIRNGHVALLFDAMNVNNISLIGSTVLTAITWIHVAVVYDASLSQQQLYVNGRIDAISSGTVNSYRGTSSGSMTTIGKSSSFAYPSSYFNGFFIWQRQSGVAETACQISNDASLLAYYPFDTTGTSSDYSNKFCNGILSGTTTVSAGRVGQAISFSSSTNYFQAPCFSTLRTKSPSYSIALWVNPSTLVGGGSLVHISSFQNGSGPICYDLLAFTTSGALVVQWMITITSVNSIQGPVLPNNIWTHVAVVYSFLNGVRLFINGQLSVLSQTINTLTLQDSFNPLYITLGNVSPLGSAMSVTCPVGSIPIASGSFAGAIDDFRLYNRELDSQDLCVLNHM